MKRSKKRNHAIIVLIVLLIALAIGYATFQTVLTVNGTATGTMTWNVHFTNNTKFYEVVDGAKADTAITDTDRANAVVNSKTADPSDPTNAQKDAQTVTATVSLKYPGDAVILETEILNESSQPAKLTGYSCTGAGDGLLITQPSSSAITAGELGSNNGDVLNATNGKCKAQFLVKWDPNAATFGDAQNHQKTFTITFTYSQDTTEKSVTTLTHSDNT